MILNLQKQLIMLEKLKETKKMRKREQENG